MRRLGGRRRPGSVPPSSPRSAFGFSAEAAREASYRSLHYHGGYGFMLEYDIQLYFRRAKAWPAQFGEPVSPTPGPPPAPGRAPARWVTVDF